MTPDTGNPDAGTELRSAELRSGGKRPDHHDSCRHQPYPCHRVSYPWRYIVGSRVNPVRWSDDDDPPFPCLCTCGPCRDWRATVAEVDGPVMLPVE